MGVVLAYSVCVAVWGTTWFAIRVCIQEGGYPTLPAAALRFTIAGLVIAAIALAVRPKPLPRGRKRLFWLTMAGVANGIGYALVYKGEETVPGGLAAVLFGTMPLFVAMLAAVTRTERIRRDQVVGVLIALIGMVVIFADRLAVSSEQAFGVALVVVAVISSAVYSLLLKRETSDVHPIAATVVFLGVTATVLWALSAVWWRPLPWPPPGEPTVALLYLALCGSVLTFLSLIYLLQRVSLMATTTLVFIQPILALFVDALWEDEIRLGTNAYLGVCITLGGVLFGSILKLRARSVV